MVKSFKRHDSTKPKPYQDFGLRGEFFKFFGRELQSFIDLSKILKEKEGEGEGERRSTCARSPIA